LKIKKNSKFSFKRCLKRIYGNFWWFSWFLFFFWKVMILRIFFSIDRPKNASLSIKNEFWKFDFYFIVGEKCTFFMKKKRKKNIFVFFYKKVIVFSQKVSFSRIIKFLKNDIFTVASYLFLFFYEKASSGFFGRCLKNDFLNFLKIKKTKINYFFWFFKMMSNDSFWVKFNKKIFLSFLFFIFVRKWWVVGFKNQVYPLKNKIIWEEFFIQIKNDFKIFFIILDNLMVKVKF